MAKAYKFTEEKRVWTRNVSAGLKVYAEKSRCPECKRKNAFHKQDYDFNLQRGLIVERCRYCRYEETRDFQTGATVKRFGKAKEQS